MKKRLIVGLVALVVLLSVAVTVMAIVIANNNGGGSGEEITTKAFPILELYDVKTAVAAFLVDSGEDNILAEGIIHGQFSSVLALGENGQLYRLRDYLPNLDPRFYYIVRIDGEVSQISDYYLLAGHID